MDKLWYIITYLFSNLLDMCISVKYMNFFFGKLKVSSRTGMLTLTLCYVASGVQYIFFPIPLINTIVSIAVLYSIAKCYEKKKSKILSVVLLVFMFQLSCEIILGYITGGGNTHMTEPGYYGEVYQLVGLSIMQIILYFIITSFKNVNSKLQLPTGFNIAIVLLAAGLYYMELILFMQENVGRNTKRISAVLTLFILLLIMYMYDTISRSYVNSFQAQMFERESIYYTRQAEVMRKNNDNIRKFKHDINNHLYVLDDMLNGHESNSMAKDYLRQMIGRLEQVKVYSASGNVQLDSIVNFKLSEAFEKNVNVEAELKLPEPLGINMGDMVTILGNILDNAIEATQKIEEGRFIGLCIKYKMGAVFITLRNSYDGNINDRNGVIKTRKSNKIEHGIGLKSVQDVVEKYNGEIAINYDDREFCISIVLYTDKYC